MSAVKVDVAIIGGGIIGLATAYQLGQRFPRASLLLLEKEAAVGLHQSGRNSGVLHSGIYYRPGSLKATNCRAGKAAMETFCESEGIPFERCGKVIVATRQDELQPLQNLFERGRANHVSCDLIGPERLRELEPHAAGLQAIHVPEAGIVDYGIVCERLATRIVAAGGQLAFNAAVTAIRHRDSSVVIESDTLEVEASCLVNCAGLYSDRIARMSGSNTTTKIVPFRGEYFLLKPAAEHLVRALIYPVPDPRFPFLGVHFTRMIRGGVECGPNAVLAFAREGYSKTDFNLRDFSESLTYRGFLKMASRYWKTGMGEMWRSLSKAAFVGALRRLIPEVTIEDLVAAQAGVRAQALSADGTLVDDFLIEETGRVVNVLNAPSPAATSSLQIGSQIVDHLASRIA